MSARPVLYGRCVPAADQQCNDDHQDHQEPDDPNHLLPEGQAGLTLRGTVISSVYIVS